MLAPRVKLLLGGVRARSKMVSSQQSLAAAISAYEAIPLGVPSRPDVRMRMDQTVSNRDLSNHRIEPDGAVSESFRG